MHPCDLLKDVQALIADPEIACYEGQHILVMVIAALGLAFYVVGCVRCLEHVLCLTHLFPRGCTHAKTACSFPFVALVALTWIDKKAEHTDAVRISQFGYLYDRRVPLRCYAGLTPAFPERKRTDHVSL